MQAVSRYDGRSSSSSGGSGAYIVQWPRVAAPSVVGGVCV